MTWSSYLAGVDTVLALICGAVIAMLFLRWWRR